MQIDKGVPIPEKRYSKKYHWVHEMEVGDSVFCEDKKAADRIRNYMSVKASMRTCIRVVADGYRVWRIK